jgi:hypothetical protein
MPTGYEVLVPQPNRQTEILRSAEDDNSRSASVDAILAKHGWNGPRRKFRGHTGTPKRYAVAGLNRGCVSVTFFHLGGSR